MSQYITLPSNSSASVFKNNVQSDYTTVINPPIVLTAPSEVALVNITYSPQINVNLGTISLNNPFYKENEPWNVRAKRITHNMMVLNGTASELFFKELTFEVKRQILVEEYTLLYNYGYEPSIYQIDTLREYYKVQEKEYDLLTEIQKKAHRHKIIVFTRGDAGFDFLLKDIYFSPILTAVGGYYTSAVGRWLFDSESLPKLKALADVIELAIPKKRKSVKKISDLFYDNSHLKPFVPESIGAYDEIATDLVKKIKELGESKDIPDFSFTDGFVKILYKNSPGGDHAHDQIGDIKFTGLLAELLELEKKDNYARISFISNLNLKYYAAIYCSIIEEQYVGDSHGPIIRLINLSNDTSKEIITLYENPHYVKCSRSVISSINIKILDLEGNPILFENKTAFVVLKLHIRKINELQ